MCPKTCAELALVLDQAERTEGLYFRSLRKDDVRRWYSGDSLLRFGYRVKPRNLQWQPDGLSVSCAICCGGHARCAIELDDSTRGYVHVSTIDLSRLREAINEPVVAKPDNDPPQPNPCHCVLVTSDTARLVHLQMAVQELLEQMQDRRPAADQTFPRGCEPEAKEFVESCELFVVIPEHHLKDPTDSTA